MSYANQAKQKLLGVSASALERDGAVSERVVIEMALGALELSGADISVAISGVAGPSGGSAEKPVGTVWFAWGKAGGKTRTALKKFSGDRIAIQKQAVAFALEETLTTILGNIIKDA